MPECRVCGCQLKGLDLNRCTYCGAYVCTEHRVPEKHDCPGVRTIARNLLNNVLDGTTNGGEASTNKPGDPVRFYTTPATTEYQAPAEKASAGNALTYSMLWDEEKTRTATGKNTSRKDPEKPYCCMCGKDLDEQTKHYCPYGCCGYYCDEHINPGNHPCVLKVGERQQVQEPGAGSGFFERLRWLLGI